MQLAEEKNGGVATGVVGVVGPFNWSIIDDDDTHLPIRYSPLWPSARLQYLWLRNELAESRFSMLEPWGHSNLCPNDLVHCLE